MMIHGVGPSLRRVTLKYRGMLELLKGQNHSHLLMESLPRLLLNRSHVRKTLMIKQSGTAIMCTLLNKPLTLSCAACGTLKEDVKFKVWSCKFCTLDNRVKLDRCLACREWRYSSAPPVPNRGPYVAHDKSARDSCRVMQNDLMNTSTCHCLEQTYKIKSEL